jgi:hypothetical protein
LEANRFVLNGLTQSAQDTPDSLTFSLGESHPLYEAFPEPPLCDLDRDGHYSFYVRVPDLPAFLLHVAPVLEENLSRSVAAGHTANLDLSFYTSGLHIGLQQGRITSARPWTPTPENPGNPGDASFPDLTFPQLLLGLRSPQELGRTFPDCSPGKADTQTLLRALFPKRPSNLQPLC